MSYSPGTRSSTKRKHATHDQDDGAATAHPPPPVKRAGGPLAAHESSPSSPPPAPSPSPATPASSCAASASSGRSSSSAVVCTSLEHCPDTVISEILRFLDTGALLNSVCCVSRRLRDLCSSAHSWKGSTVDLFQVWSEQVIDRARSTHMWRMAAGVIVPMALPERLLDVAGTMPALQTVLFHSSPGVDERFFPPSIGVLPKNVVKALLAIPSLKRLCAPMSGPMFSSGGWTQPLESLEIWPGSACTVEIAMALATLCGSKLKYLRLESALFGDELAHVLATQCPNLQVLISACDFDDSMILGHLTSTGMNQVVSRCRRLRRIRVDQAGKCFGQVHKIAESLPDLTELNLEGLTTPLDPIVCQISSLRSLELKNCVISEDVIAKGIGMLPNLKALTITVDRNGCAAACDLARTSHRGIQNTVDGPQQQQIERIVVKGEFATCMAQIIRGSARTLEVVDVAFPFTTSLPTLCQIVAELRKCKKLRRLYVWLMEGDHGDDDRSSDASDVAEVDVDMDTGTTGTATSTGTGTGTDAYADADEDDDEDDDDDDDDDEDAGGDGDGQGGGEVDGGESGSAPAGNNEEDETDAAVPTVDLNHFVLVASHPHYLLGMLTTVACIVPTLRVLDLGGFALEREQVRALSQVRNSLSVYLEGKKIT